jgi:FlaA1/EpsC-like NDP-sugar epimerase
MIVGDVVNPVYVEVDQIYHLACPASPPHYQYNPIKTIKTSTDGTLNMLGLAKRVKARILLTSTYVPFVSFFFLFFHISFVGLSLRFFLRSAVSQPLTTYLPPLKK